MNFQKKSWLCLLVCFLGNIVIVAQNKPKESDGPQKTNKNGATSTNTPTIKDSDPGQISSKQSGAVIWKSPDGTLYVNALAEFQLISKDKDSGLAKIFYSINHSKFKRYRGSFHLNQSGLNRIKYFAIDQSGNKEPLRLYHVSLDNTSPEVAFTLDNTAYYENGKYYVKKGTQVTIDTFDDVSGVAAVYLNRGNGIQPVSINTSFAVAQEGNLIYAAHAIDHVQNKSKTIQLVLVSDHQAPRVTIKSLYRFYKDRKYCPVSGRLELLATDNLSGVKILQYRLPTDTGWRTYVHPILIKTKSNEFTATLRAIDRSGNISKVLQFSCIYDNKRPTTRVK